MGRPMGSATTEKHALATGEKMALADGAQRRAGCRRVCRGSFYREESTRLVAAFAARSREHQSDALARIGHRRAAAVDRYLPQTAGARGVGGGTDGVRDGRGRRHAAATC